MGLTKRTFWQHPAFGDRRWRLFAALPSTRRDAPPVDLADTPHLDGWLVARDEAGSEWRRTQRQFRRCRVAAGARCDYYVLTSYLVARNYGPGALARRVNRTPTSRPVAICRHEFTVCWTS